MIRKVLKKVEMDKLDELERKLNYAAIKSRFWGRPSSIEE